MNSRRLLLWPAAVASILAAATLDAGAQTQPIPLSNEPAKGSHRTVEVILPRHTLIPVLVDKDIRVGGAGDALEQKGLKLEVAQDVIIDGFLIAEKGDLAEGHITTEKNITKRVFSANTSQEVSLDIDDIVNYCGDTIHMQFERTYVGGMRGGFLSFGTHTHDAVFNKGKILKARTDRVEKSICAQKTAAPSAPLPADMIVPDEEVHADK